MTGEVDPSEAISHGVVVRPGDALVVALRDAVTPDQAQQIKRRVEELMAGVEASVVVAVGVDQLAVYRPDGREQGG